MNMEVIEAIRAGIHEMKNKAPKKPVIAPAINPSKNLILEKGCFNWPYGPTNLETESPKAKIMIDAIAMFFGNNKTTKKAPKT